MAIFETFTLLFKADSAQLKKEVDDVKKKTGELTDTSKKSEEQTKKTDGEFEKFAKTLAKTAAAYFSISSVVAGFQSTLSKTLSVGKASNILGVDVEDLDALGRAFKNFGGEASEFESAIATLAAKFRAPGQTIADYVLELSEAVSKLDKTSAQLFLQENLGLSPLIASYILEGPERLGAEFAEQKRLGVTTQEDVELANEFNASLGRLGDAFDRLFRAASTDLIPGLIRFLDSLTALLTAFYNGRNKLKEIMKTPNEERPWYLRDFPTLKDSKKEKDVEKIKETKDLGWDEWLNTPAEAPPDPYEHLRYVPTLIAPMSNSQSSSFNVGDVTINTTAQNGKQLGQEFMAQIKQDSQYMQANAYFDDAVVI